MKVEKIICSICGTSLLVIMGTNFVVEGCHKPWCHQEHESYERNFNPPYPGSGIAQTTTSAAGDTGVAGPSTSASPSASPSSGPNGSN
jgi:hypothetical protein